MMASVVVQHSMLMMTTINYVKIPSREDLECSNTKVTDMPVSSSDHHEFVSEMFYSLCQLSIEKSTIKSDDN